MRFLGESLGFSLCKIMSYMNRDNFTCSFPVWMPFVSFFATTPTSNIYWTLQENVFLPPAPSTEKHNIDISVEEKCSVKFHCLSQNIHWSMHSELRGNKLITDTLPQVKSTALLLGSEGVKEILIFEEHMQLSYVLQFLIFTTLKR